MSKSAPSAPRSLSRILLATCAVAAVLAGVWLWRGNAAQQSAGKAKATGSVVESAAPRAGTALKAEAPAEQYALKFAFQSLQEGRPFVDFALDGKLELIDITPATRDLPEAKSAALGEHIVYALFHGALLLSQAGQALAPDVTGPLSADFQLPVFAKFDKDGQFQRAYFAPGVERMVQTTLRSLMTNLQFVRAGSPGASWESDEADSNGHYLAKYTSEAAAPGLFTKSKQKYLRSFGNAGHRVDQHEAHYRFALLANNPATRPSLTALREFSLVERLHVTPFGTITQEVDGNTQLSLKHQATDERFYTDRTLSDLANLLRGYEMLGLEEAGTSEATTRELDQSITQNASFESTLIALRKAGDSADDKKGRANAYRQFASLLRLHPEKASEVAAWIKSGDPLTNTLVAALRDANTKASQAALVDVFRAPNVSEAVKTDSLRALSLVGNPTSEATALLREVAKGQGINAEQALYGLGTHAARATANGGDAAPLVRDLTAGLAQAKDPGEQARYLTALGNAGSRNALDPIQAQTKSPTEGTRREAVHALRLIPGSDVDSLLAEQLLSAEPALVRVQAARAIRDREQTSTLKLALAQTLKTEREQLVKNAVIQTDALWVKNSSEIRDSLVWFVAHETDEMLKRGAEVVLASLAH